jgi:CelD/BcsL family acetyltransferase involved in cellulose biosynthesis
MRALARRDQMRGWLLFVDARPISYLYAPAEGDTLIYAYLGYDPEFADLSPGTVLQLEAMRQLMDEDGFRLFDFTEGEGQHKTPVRKRRSRLRRPVARPPYPSQPVRGPRPERFDAAVALAKRAVNGLGIGGALRRLRR